MQYVSIPTSSLSTDIKEILSFTRLGFILAYSTSRPASLSVTKFLLSKLPAVPKMLVAVVLGQSCDDHMIEEGRQIAQSYDALFVCTSDLDWASKSHNVCVYITIRLSQGYYYHIDLTAKPVPWHQIWTGIKSKCCLIV